MRRSPILLITAVVVAAGCGGSASSVVRTDGSIGSFRLDVTTEHDLRAKLGEPDGLITKLDPAVTAPKGGRTLVYVCGHGCRTEYSFNNQTGKLSDFWTQSARFMTARGSHSGMRATRAEALEDQKVHPGCGGDQIGIRLDQHHAYVLGVWRGRVNTITFLGPHSVYYDGLC